MEQRSHKLRNGTFQNLSDTPQLAAGVRMASVMKDFFFKPRPAAPAHVPTVKTNLKTYYSKTPTIFWFGHSSYLVHCDGFNILVDPVFSGHASPVSFYIKAFNGSDIYKPADMPVIDMLIITHNHYDHLDTATIKALSPSTKAFFMPLGVSQYVKPFIKNNQPITEMDWWQSIDISNNLKLTAAPARHFSGRGFKRNASLWASFILMINGYSIFIGSDSGYDTHFKTIGDAYGPFDIALLECGQYNNAWPYIHSMPEELIIEGKELKASVVMPVHWGKFALAFHEWDEPVKRFVKAAEEAHINYTTPIIGEPVVLDESYPKINWWA